MINHRYPRRRIRDAHVWRPLHLDTAAMEQSGDSVSDAPQRKAA
jgi:hypothetical protein